VFAFVLLAALLALAQNKPNTGADKPTAASPDPFSVAIVERSLDALRSAILQQRSAQVLALFEPSMPGYDNVGANLGVLFERYSSFRVRYHILQTVEERSAAMVEFTLEAAPLNPAEPSVRRTQQIRFDFVLVGRQWKIADFQPRDLLANF
jgi:hypothetical protein